MQVFAMVRFVSSSIPAADMSDSAGFTTSTGASGPISFPPSACHKPHFAHWPSISPDRQSNWCEGDVTSQSRALLVTDQAGQKSPPVFEKVKEAVLPDIR